MEVPVTIDIVPMPEERRDEVMTVFTQVFSGEPVWGMFDPSTDLAIFDNPQVQWWVAVDRESGAIAGFIAGCVADAPELCSAFGIPMEYLHTQGKIGYKAEIGVLRQYAGRGIAGTLTRALLTYCTQQDVVQFAVYTRVGTGNYGWYEAKLNHLGTTTDGRVFFGCNGTPEL